MTSHRINNIKRDVQLWGWGKAAFRRIAIYLQRILGIHCFKVGTRNLTEKVPLETTVLALEFRQLDEAEVSGSVDLDGMEIDAEFLKNALNRGEKITGAFHGPILVGFAITATLMAPHTDDIWVKFETDYSYLYKLFVHPRYRGKRIGPAIVLQSDAAARADGFAKGLTFVSIVNFSSLRLRGRVSAEPAGYAGYFKIGPIFWPFATKRAKESGFAFFVPGV